MCEASSKKFDSGKGWRSGPGLEEFQLAIHIEKVDSESIDARLYKFDGDCYLGRAMDAEAIKATKEGGYITLVWKIQAIG
ncbi:hypothetical protein BOTCAL_0044g00060 [Botryotinia calthae]|uniref:Uncharacterized protein n=1 Tax=Botryotinia calthae TaxID=38488 RepID=A0A4Y8DC04_9HELO|nr:hypothetical protein BOTCAL_0044g00060 [Botryotinia calthae]